MVDILEDVFPGLHSGNYQLSSPRTNRYNCIAWAANDMLNWWWPVSDSRFFWPPQAPRVETLDAFEAAFALSEYVVCDDGQLEPRFEKIALFADAERFPTHAARQLVNGRWTSKLGECEDIEHKLHDIEGAAYGTVARYMKRLRPPVAD